MSSSRPDQPFIHGALNAELTRIPPPKTGLLQTSRAAWVFHPRSLHFAQRSHLKRIAKWSRYLAALHCCSSLVSGCYRSLNRGYVFQSSLPRVARFDSRQLTDTSFLGPQTSIVQVGEPACRDISRYTPHHNEEPLDRHASIDQFVNVLQLFLPARAIYVFRCSHSSPAYLELF